MFNFLRAIVLSSNLFFRRVKRPKITVRLVLIEHWMDHLYIVLDTKMRKISTHVLYFICTLAGLTPGLVAAAIDDAATLTSSDPGVLKVTPTDGGLFRVDVVGPGTCQLIASGDADLGDGVKTITSTFDYTVFDAGIEADHFELTAVQFEYQPVVAGASTAPTAG